MCASSPVTISMSSTFSLIASTKPSTSPSSITSAFASPPNPIRVTAEVPSASAFFILFMFDSPHKSYKDLFKDGSFSILVKMSSYSYLKVLVEFLFFVLFTFGICLNLFIFFLYSLYIQCLPFLLLSIYCSLY